jgi:phage shock protein C
MKESLFRARNDRVFGGVARGISNYINLDVILVRILFILITLISGVGILLYIILWIVVPEEPIENLYTSATKNSFTGDPSQATASANFEFTQKKSSGSGKIVFGIILILIGAIFLLDKLLPYFDFDIVVPLILIGAGIMLIWNFFK